MSDRDDIDVVDKAGNVPADSDSENNTIRQNSPADSTEKSQKPGFFERLKRAFSTDDETEVQDTSENEEIFSGNSFGSLIERFRKPKETESADETVVPAEAEQTDSETKVLSQETSNKAEIKAEIIETDSAEMEELLMISAFLEGEEYHAPEPKPATDTPSETAEIGDYDSQSAFEEEEAVFVLDFEEEETEASDNIAAETAQNDKKDISDADDSVAEHLPEETPSAADEALADENTHKDGESRISEISESAPSVSISDSDDGETSYNKETENVEKADDDGQEKSEHSEIPENDGDTSDITDSDGEAEQKTENICENTAENIIENTTNENTVEDTAENTENHTTEENKTEDISAEGGEDKLTDTNETDNTVEGGSESSEYIAADISEASDETPSNESTDVPEDDDDEEFVFEEEFLFDEGDDELSEPDVSDDFEEISTIFVKDVEGSTERIPRTKEYNLKESDSEPLETELAETDADEVSNSESVVEENVGIVEIKPSEEAEQDITEVSADSVVEALDTESLNQNDSESSSPSVSAEESKPEKEKSDNAEENAPTSDSIESDISDSVKTADHETENNAENTTAENVGAIEASVEGTSENTENAIENTSENIHESENKARFVPEEDKAESKAGVRGLFSKARAKMVELWNTKDSNKSKNETNATDSFTKELLSADADEVKDTPSAVETENDRGTETEAEDVIKEADKPLESDTAEEQKEASETAENEKKSPVISVIKNENATESSFDEEKLRGQLNVIELNDEELLKEEQQRRVEADKRVYERVQEFEKQTEAKREQLRQEAQAREAKPESGTVNPITELEISNYRPAPDNEIKFKVGNFFSAVNGEYECIINYKRMISVSTKEALTETVPVQAPSSETTAPAVSEEMSEADLEDLKNFERDGDKVESIGNKLDFQDKRKPEPIEYRTEDDALEVRKHLTSKRRKTMITFSITMGITIASLIFTLFAGRFTVGSGAGSLESLQRVFAAVNFLLYAGALFCCKDMLLEGLLPLREFKANKNTGIATAAAATALQALLSIIFPKAFLSQSLNVYTLLVLLLLSAASAGDYLNADRINSNFRFVSDDSQKYAGKFFPDQRVVSRLLSGVKNDHNELSFQKKTAFLKHFMKLSNTEDTGNKLSTSFSLPSIILSVILAIVVGLGSTSFFDAWSALCLVLCVGVPFSSRLFVSMPMHYLCRKSLLNKSMIVGCTAVDTFSESAAVMIDAKDLYPEGSIQLNDFKIINDYRWQNGVYAAAAVTKAAGGAMTGVLDTIIPKDKRAEIPTADGVRFEDGKGLVAWVKNEQVCIGNRKLLKSHGIYPPTEEEEDAYRVNGDDLLYIALSGQLVGVLIVSYNANHRVSDVLKRMEASDMTILIRTTDVNITAERVAHDFGIGLRSIKVLEQKSSNVIRDEMVGKEKSSPAFIATKGGLTSFGLAVSECIQLKRNITLSNIIEVVGAMLKILAVSFIVILSGIQQVSSMAICLCSLLWGIAVIIAPIIAQHVNNKTSK